MKKAELITGAIALIAIVLNSFLIPLSDVLLVLSFTLLAIIYGYLSFALFNNIQLRRIFKKSSYKGISTMRVVGAILTGLALSSTLVGILFTLMSFPGAFPNLILGTVGLTVALIVGLVKYSKSKSVYYTNIFKRIAVCGGVALMLLVLPANAWQDFKYRDYPALLEAMKEARVHPENPELWEKVQDERDKMNLKNPEQESK